VRALAVRVPFPQTPRHRILARPAAGWRLELCLGLPPPASAKLAKSTVNKSQIASCVTNPRNPGSAVKDSHGRQGRTDHGHKHDRILHHQPRVQFFERVADSRTDNVSNRKARLVFAS